MDLFPNTLYTVSVYPVNGAGNGMPDTRTVNTLNGESRSLSVWCLAYSSRFFSVNIVMFTSYTRVEYLLFLEVFVQLLFLLSVPSSPTSSCC